MQDKLFEVIEKFKLPLALSVLGFVLIIGGIFTSGLNKTTPKKEDFPKESLVSAERYISVDVSGAVNNPGVYKLKEGSRIEDAVNSAGGFSEKVNSEYISKTLNLAQKLQDGTKVYVPLQGEQVAGVQTAGSGASNAQSKININTSSQGEIEGLPGVGPVTATKIISGRPYQVLDDLLSKKAVTRSVFEKIKDLVVLY